MKPTTWKSSPPTPHLSKVCIHVSGDDASCYLCVYDMQCCQIDLKTAVSWIGIGSNVFVYVNQ